MWKEPQRDVFRVVLTPEEQAEVDDVLDLAAAYVRVEPGERRACLAMARGATTARARRQAAQTVRGDDARHPALMAFLAGLIETTPNAPLWTERGWITDEELALGGGRVTREDGREIVLFPIRIRDGQAIYRRLEERAAHHASFSTKVGTAAPRQTSWWMTEGG